MFRSIIKEETRQLFMWPVIRVGKKLYSTFKVKVLTRTSRFVCFSGFVQLSTVLCKFDQSRPCSGEIFPKFRLKTVDISIIFIILLIIIIFVVVIIIIIIIIAMNRPCTILVISHFL